MITPREDTYSNDSEGAEEAARALWEDENGDYDPDLDASDYEEYPNYFRG